MAAEILLVLRIVLMAIPLYLCNGLALVFGGRTPIDLNKKFLDGRPLLGKGKTFKGTISGIAFAYLGTMAISMIFPQTKIIMGVDYFYYGSLLAVGAVLGDFAGSFLKRRVRITRGKSVALLDQLDFVFGGIILGLVMMTPTIFEFGLLLAVTLLSHIIGNHFAFFARLKKVPW